MSSITELFLPGCLPDCRPDAGQALAPPHENNAYLCSQSNGCRFFISEPYELKRQVAKNQDLKMP
jgi:hypothetical protein